MTQLADISTILAIIGGLLGAAGVIGASVAVLRARLLTTTIEVYRQDNEALRGRVTTLLESHDECLRAAVISDARITALEKERTMLRDLVTGASAIEGLREQIMTYHRELLQRVADLSPSRGS